VFCLSAFLNSDVPPPGFSFLDPKVSLLYHIVIAKWARPEGLLDRSPPPPLIRTFACCLSDLLAAWDDQRRLPAGFVCRRLCLSFSKLDRSARVAASFQRNGACLKVSLVGNRFPKFDLPPVRAQDHSCTFRFLQVLWSMIPFCPFHVLGDLCSFSDVSFFLQRSFLNFSLFLRRHVLLCKSDFVSRLSDIRPGLFTSKMYPRFGIFHLTVFLGR